jgi:hypothetical protein
MAEDTILLIEDNPDDEDLILLPNRTLLQKL